MEGTDMHPAVARVLRDHDAPELITLLADRLTGADLTAVMLEVARRRSAMATPSTVLNQYERDRFVRPATLDAQRLLRLQLLAYEAVNPPFLPVATSPLVPLGTHAAIAGVHQNRVMTTTRGSEVAADPTNTLALEAAVRRRSLLASDSRSTQTVHLANAVRVVRAQQFDTPRSFPHFTLLGLVSAGRDTGSHSFEKSTMEGHIRALGEVAAQLGIKSVTVRLTDFSGEQPDVIDAVVAAMDGGPLSVAVWPDRSAGQGYYQHVCFKMFVVEAGEQIEIADGGIVNWTQLLVGSKKERLMISAIGLERLASLALTG
jgi:hypothetical protein